MTDGPPMPTSRNAIGSSRCLTKVEMMKEDRLSQATGSDVPTLLIRGALARIALGRSKSHNRLELNDIDRLIDFCDELDGTSRVTVVIFESSGTTFSSGFDLKVLSQSAKAEVRKFEYLTDRIERLTAISIARLHGPVYGGATDLALACDFRIGVRGMKMRMPAVHLGVHYYPHGMRRWVERLGAAASRRLFLMGEDIPDHEMLRMGYLDQLVDVEQLDAALLSCVERLNSSAPDALRSMKKSLNEIISGEADEGILYQRLDRSLTGSELHEALHAFGEKRAPVFASAK